jgi:hypothetical protein
MVAMPAVLSRVAGIVSGQAQGVVVSTKTVTPPVTTAEIVI